MPDELTIEEAPETEVEEGDDNTVVVAPTIIVETPPEPEPARDELADIRASIAELGERISALAALTVVAEVAEEPPAEAPVETVIADTTVADEVGGGEDSSDKHAGHWW